MESTVGKGVFACRQCCDSTDGLQSADRYSTPAHVYQHSLVNHPSLSLKIWIIVDTLDPRSGVIVKATSKNFKLTATEIETRAAGRIVFIEREIDKNDLTLRFRGEKRRLEEKSQDQDEGEEEQERAEEAAEETLTLSDEELGLLLSGALKALSNRQNDLIGLLRGLSEGTIKADNVGVNVALDIGRFASLPDTRAMRYPPATMDFWFTVDTVLGSRATRLFRGYMNQGTTDDASGNLRPEDAAYNFVVPSDKTLQNLFKPYRTEVTSPGVIASALDSFARINAGKACKLAVDGKKVAMGFDGEFGDANLDGHEKPPALSERKARLESEMRLFDELQEMAGLSETFRTIPEPELSNLLKSLMSVVSQRVRELKKANLNVRNMVARLEKGLGAAQTWEASKFHRSISFHKLKSNKMKDAVKALLGIMDKLGLLLAHIQGTAMCYVMGEGPVRLDTIPDSTCLRSYTGTLNDGDVARYSPQIKQEKSETSIWMKAREKARITGSSIFAGIGCDTLKKQNAYLTQKKGGKKVEFTEEAKKAMEHGTRNEINGLATLLAKLLPVFFPVLNYIEDGFEMMQLDNNHFMVVSGDGTLVNADSQAEVAVEIKCPTPGKKFTVDTWTKLPSYYTTQVLSQMASKKCKRYANICWTPSGTTLVVGEFDPDVWNDVLELLEEIYAQEQLPGNSSRKNAKSKPLREKLNEYASKSCFVAEFPSLYGIACPVPSTDDIKETLHRHEGAGRSLDDPSINEVLALCADGKRALTEGYELLRSVCKEVFVVVISNLDRVATAELPEAPHAVPVAYYLVGFSVTMAEIRSILKQVIGECAERKLNVASVCFDGQFIDLCSKNFDGTPLTLLQLSRDVWRNALTQSKSDILKQVSAVTDFSARDRAAKASDIQSSRQGTERKLVVAAVNPLVPRDVVMPTNARAVFKINGSGLCWEGGNRSSVSVIIPPETERDEEGALLEPMSEHDLIEAALREVEAGDEETTEREFDVETDDGGTDVVQASASPAKEVDRESKVHKFISTLKAHNFDRWSDLDQDEVESFLFEPESLNALKKEELKLVLCGWGVSKIKSNSTKGQLIEMIYDDYWGQDAAQVKSPEKLRKMLKLMFRSQPKRVLATIIATNDYIKQVEEWSKNLQYSEPCAIKTPEKEYQIKFWYSKSSQLGDHPVQASCDPHHLFVNGRCHVCSRGFPQLGIFREAWHDVAKRDKEYDTGLTEELAVQLRDRQRNSFAQTTFSERVEEAMKKIGQLTGQKNKFDKSAEWCRLFREFNQAVDERGIDVATRVEWLLAMRSKLLSIQQQGVFPPPGKNVKGLSIAQYEGMLTNIDGRLQLWGRIGPFNQRAMSSLDNETLFAGFQDYDPHGTGQVAARDVPRTLACCSTILTKKLDPDRTYYMRTSKRIRVYDQPVGNVRPGKSGRVPSLVPISTPEVIYVWPHAFDDPKTRKAVPRRKTGTIRKESLPARGEGGVRAFHKLREAEIAPHKRARLTTQLLDADYNS